MTADYLVSGKGSVIADTIPAIKADKRLNLKAKKMLIPLVEELRVDGEKTQTISHVISVDCNL